MNLLDLIFKNEKPEKETLTDDLIITQKPKIKRVTNTKPI